MSAFPIPHVRNSHAVGAGARSAALLLFAAAMLLAGPALARPFDDTPCAKDANDLCGEERPATRPLRECLKAGIEQKKVEPACEAFIANEAAERHAAAMKKKEDFWIHCRADVDKFCAKFSDNRFNAGRCLRHRRDELSEECVPHMPKFASSVGPSIPDPSEPDEDRIARAEARRPGIGGDQMRRKIKLEKMTEEEREAFLAKERAEGVPSAQQAAQERIKAITEGRMPGAAPKISEEERAAQKAEREAARAARQAEWQAKREERMKQRAAQAAEKMKQAGEEAASEALPQGDAAPAL